MDIALAYSLRLAYGAALDCTIAGPAAQDLLCALFLAAASSGRSLRECGRWLADAGSPIPAELLDVAGFHALAWSLRGAQNGAPETRDGICQTARTAAKCLNDKVIGAGIDDPRHARDLATLVGQHDVPVTSVSYGDGRTSQQVSLRRQEILEPADIRALPPGSALLLATGAPPGADQPQALVHRPGCCPDHRGHRPRQSSHAARRPSR